MMTRIRVESIAVVEVDAGDREVRTAAGQRLAVPPSVDDPANPTPTPSTEITAPNTKITTLGIYNAGRGLGARANERASRFFVLGVFPTRNRRQEERRAESAAFRRNDGALRAGKLSRQQVDVAAELPRTVRRVRQTSAVQANDPVLR